MEQKIEEGKQLLELLQEKVEMLISVAEKLTFGALHFDDYIRTDNPRADALTVKVTQFVVNLTALLSDLAVALTDRNKDSGTTIRLLVTEARKQVEDAYRAIQPLTFKTDDNGMVAKQKEGGHS